MVAALDGTPVGGVQGVGCHGREASPERLREPSHLCAGACDHDVSVVVDEAEEDQPGAADEREPADGNVERALLGKESQSSLRGECQVPDSHGWTLFG